MPLWFNKKLNLQPEELMHVIRVGSSLAEMAKLIGVSRPTFYTYLKMYSDENGVPFTDIALKYASENLKKKKMENAQTKKRFIKTSMTSILLGKHPTYNRKTLQRRLIDEGVFEEKCALCGFEERRVLDYKVPLILIFKDGNKQNHVKDNMEFCCYNCFFLNYNDLKISADKYSTDYLYRIK
jgi:hypothetical protein